MSRLFTFFLALLLASIQAAVTVNQVTGISSNNLVYSGSIPVGSDSLFFTYYGPDGVVDPDDLFTHPLIVFVGNPGTSAQYYSLGGAAPKNLNNDMSLSNNPHSLTKKASVMFLDLLGNGFSFASDPNSLPTKAADFGQQLTQALNTLAKENPLGQSDKIVIAGESTFIRSLVGLEDIDALKGVIHLSPWPEMYAMGLYYGVAGLELKIYTEASRIAIDSTFASCANYIRNSKYLEAHQCIDSIFNFVEDRTKNTNLFDVRQGYNLTEHLPRIQYYFSQSSTVSTWKAPNTRLFESQTGYISANTYNDLSKNYNKELSQFTKDYFSVRHLFITGSSDYITYYKGTLNWIQNDLTFVEKDAFKKAKLEEIVSEGKTVGYSKAVKQMAYAQILDAGHYCLHDKPEHINPLILSWVDSLLQDRHLIVEQ